MLKELNKFDADAKFSEVKNYQTDVRSASLSLAGFESLGFRIQCPMRRNADSPDRRILVPLSS